MNKDVDNVVLKYLLMGYAQDIYEYDHGCLINDQLF